MIYIPFWILYWLWFCLFINYFIKFCIILVLLFVCSKILKMPNIRKFTKTIKTLCIAAFAEIIGIVVWGLCDINIERNTYDEYYTLFCSLAFFITIIISFLLNYFFNLNKMNLSKKQRVLISVSLTLFLAPYLFLLPQWFVYW